MQIKIDVGGYDIMEILNVIVSSVASIIVLFLLTKLEGNRQMSEITMFDYICGITIGSIAAEFATSLEDFMKPLVAMIVYGLFTFFVAVLTCKSIKIRRFMTGKPIILYENGKIYEKNLRKAKIDINEFLMQCRNNGYFNLTDVEVAVLESNGKISILPASTNRPVTTNDLNLNPPKENIPVNVIIDGKIMKKNLKFSGNDEQWLIKELKNAANCKVSEVFLATCDINNKLSVYKKTNKAVNKDIFE